MLNPQWLKSFSSLVEVGSFTRAAERLDLTQAAVSQHVRHLEQQLGPLLIRRPRQLELTPAGSALLEYCAELEQATRRLDTRLTEAEADTGEISIITPGSIGLSLYPALLDLQQANPGLSVRYRFAPDREVLDAVLDNRFELGIVSLKPDDPRLTASHFAEEPLELIVPAGEEVHGWDDLERIGFIDHADGRAMLARLLARWYPGNPGVSRIPSRGFSNQISLMLEPVARGLGFTVLPRHACEAFPRQDAIHIVPCSTPVIDTLWLIHRAEWPLTARAQRAEACLRGVCPLKKRAG